MNVSPDSPVWEASSSGDGPPPQDGGGLTLIVAMDPQRVIGRDGELPWRLSGDLRRFKRLTMGHHLLMGRRTWDSIGRPLPGRTSIVITRQPHLALPSGVLQAGSIEAALALASDDLQPFVIGGGEIYRLALPHARLIYLTEVLETVAGDTRFPELLADHWEQLCCEPCPAGERDEFATRFRVLRRR